MVGLPVCGCPAVGEGDPPAGFVFPSDGPCTAMPRCEGAALAVSREFPWGVETGYFAKAASLDLEHAQEAFERLALRGYVTEVETRIRWYYGSRQAKLWREIPRGELLARPVPRYKPQTLVMIVCHPSSGGCSGRDSTRGTCGCPSTRGTSPLACSLRGDQ